MVLMTSKNVRLGQTLRLSRETFSLTSQNKRAQKKKQNKTKCSHFKWIAFRMSCICVFHFNGVDDYSRVEIYIYIYTIFAMNKAKQKKIYVLMQMKFHTKMASLKFFFVWNRMMKKRIGIQAKGWQGIVHFKFVWNQQSAKNRSM